MSPCRRSIGGRSEARDPRSLLPWVRGEVPRGRDLHLYGTFGQSLAATDGCHTVFLSPRGDGGLPHAYSGLTYDSLTDDTSAVPVASGPILPGRDESVWKISVPARLREAGAPVEQFMRLGLVGA